MPNLGAFLSNRSDKIYGLQTWIVKFGLSPWDGVYSGIGVHSS